VTERDFVHDLAEVGVQVRSVWDLVNTDLSYPQAVPVLIAWLSKARSMAGTDNDRSRMVEGVARALTVREARPAAAPALIDGFREIEDAMARWAIGSALEVVADRSVVDDLLAVARERRYGMSRQLVVTALGKVGQGRPDVVAALVDLLDDDDVVEFAVAALGALKADAARADIARLTDHPRPLVRTSAKRALRKLDKVAGG
jgi:hypothetical protein